MQKHKRFDMSHILILKRETSRFDMGEVDCCTSASRLLSLYLEKYLNEKLH